MTIALMSQEETKIVGSVKGAARAEAAAPAPKAHLAAQAHTLQVSSALLTAQTESQEDPVPDFQPSGALDKCFTGRRGLVDAVVAQTNAMNNLSAAAAGLTAYLVEQQQNNTIKQQAVLAEDQKAIDDFKKAHPKPEDYKDYAQEMSNLVQVYNNHSQQYNAANTLLSSPVDVSKQTVTTQAQVQQQYIQQGTEVVQLGGFLSDLMRR